MDADRASNGAVRAWLTLAVVALLVSTGYVLVIVLARSGFTQLIGDSERLFHTALVLHVDFALIVWLLAIAAMVWTFSSPVGQIKWRYLDPLLSFTGVILMLFSPLLGTGRPIVSDYLLLLDHPLFLLGLGLFFSGIGLSALRFLMTSWRRQESKDWEGITLLAVKGSVLAFCSAIAAFLIAAFQLWDQPGGLAYYNQLFWGAGHLLQFTYLFLLMAAWGWFWRQAGYCPRVSMKITRIVLWSLMLLVVSGPLLYLLLDETRTAFTRLMEISGSLALFLLMLSLFQGVAQDKRATGERVFVSIASYSMALFIAGVLIGFFVRENDAMVPAHYHGMVGAVTLAFMGLAYRMNKLLGLNPQSKQILLLQARLYAVGLGLVMLGLILSDLPRKALTGDASMDVSLLAGRFVMALGGTGAFLASLLFIALMWRVFQPVQKKIGWPGLLESRD